MQIPKNRAESDMEQALVKMAFDVPAYGQSSASSALKKNRIFISQPTFVVFGNPIPGDFLEAIEGSGRSCCPGWADPERNPAHYHGTQTGTVIDTYTQVALPNRIPATPSYKPMSSMTGSTVLVRGVPCPQ